MNGYFLAIIILQMLCLGIHLAKHGEERKDRYNFLTALISGIINLGLIYMAIKKGF